MRSLQKGRRWLPPMLAVLLVLASSMQLLVHSAPAGSRLADVCFAAPAAAGPLGMPMGAPATAQKLCALCIAALHGACVESPCVPPPAIATSRPDASLPLRPMIVRLPDHRARAPPSLV